MLVYPWERAREALRASRDLMEAGAPDELTLFAVLLTAPPEAPFPPELQGRPVAVVGVAWCGDLGGGRARARAAARELPAALDLVAPMPYVALQSMLDATAPHGWQLLRPACTTSPDGQRRRSSTRCSPGFERVPTPQSHVVTGWMGGAIDRVAPGATAFGHRGARAFTWIIGCSGDEPIDAGRRLGARRCGTTPRRSPPAAST